MIWVINDMLTLTCPCPLAMFTDPTTVVHQLPVHSPGCCGQMRQLWGWLVVACDTLSGRLSNSSNLIFVEISIQLGRKGRAWRIQLTTRSFHIIFRFFLRSIACAAPYSSQEHFLHHFQINGIWLSSQVSYFSSCSLVSLKRHHLQPPYEFMHQLSNQYQKQMAFFLQPCHSYTISVFITILDTSHHPLPLHTLIPPFTL